MQVTGEPSSPQVLHNPGEETGALNQQRGASLPCPFGDLLPFLRTRGSAPLDRQGRSWVQGHPSKHPQGVCHACLSDHMTPQSWLGASEGSGDSQKGWCLGWVSSDHRGGGRRGGELGTSCPEKAAAAAEAAPWPAFSGVWNSHRLSIFHLL